MFDLFTSNAFFQNYKKSQDECSFWERLVLEFKLFKEYFQKHLKSAKSKKKYHLDPLSAAAGEKIIKKLRRRGKNEEGGRGQGEKEKIEFTLLFLSGSVWIHVYVGFWIRIRMWKMVGSISDNINAGVYIAHFDISKNMARQKLKLSEIS